MDQEQQSLLSPNSPQNMTSIGEVFSLNCENVESKNNLSTSTPSENRKSDAPKNNHVTHKEINAALAMLEGAKDRYSVGKIIFLVKICIPYSLFIHCFSQMSLCTYLLHILTLALIIHLKLGQFIQSYRT
jgi:hypothetical protein